MKNNFSYFFCFLTYIKAGKPFLYYFIGKGAAKEKNV